MTYDDQWRCAVCGRWWVVIPLAEACAVKCRAKAEVDE